MKKYPLFLLFLFLFLFPVNIFAVEPPPPPPDSDGLYCSLDPPPESIGPNWVPDRFRVVYNCPGVATLNAKLGNLCFETSIKDTICPAAGSEATNIQGDTIPDPECTKPDPRDCPQIEVPDTCTRMECDYIEDEDGNLVPRGGCKVAYTNQSLCNFDNPGGCCYDSYTGKLLGMGSKNWCEGADWAREDVIGVTFDSTCSGLQTGCCIINGEDQGEKITEAECRGRAEAIDNVWELKWDPNCGVESSTAPIVPATPLPVPVSNTLVFNLYNSSFGQKLNNGVFRASILNEFTDPSFARFFVVGNLGIAGGLGFLLAMKIKRRKQVKA